MAIRNNPILPVGGRNCLDFVNTANWSAEGELVEEKLQSDEDVALWCRVMGLGNVTGKTGGLPEIRIFRKSLRKIFVAAINDAAPPKSDLDTLNEILSSITEPALRPAAETGFALEASLTLNQAIAVSALALLSRKSEISRVKICPGTNCAWLFLDESKNRRRTWCAMETCGNRAKAQRHYRRRTGS